jgi:Na+/H+ antiporter NhaD/arsenite permease-like protein
MIFAIPIAYPIFGLMLAGVAVLHRRALSISLAGLALLLACHALFPVDHQQPGLAGLGAHIASEWVLLADLLLLLLGFAVLADQFERSKAPEAVAARLPEGWTGGLALLGLVFCLSAFLDNIAAAVIGGVVARHVYGDRISIGFLAALVAASNAGGAGSVLGDTTTTLLWLGGVSPLAVAPAFIGAIAAFAVFGLIGAAQQHRHAPVRLPVGAPEPIDWPRVAVVGVMLASIVTANLLSKSVAGELHHLAPVTGLALWLAIAATSLVRRPQWSVLGPAFRGAVFLTSLVAAASLLPLENLPHPGWPSTLSLGLLSAVFDNIPLTAMALKQGGYDWALLAYAVGFGGSIAWFGSSAGVALTGAYPQNRSLLAWVRCGWHVPVAFAVGFAVMMALRAGGPADQRPAFPEARWSKAGAAE